MDLPLHHIRVPTEGGSGTDFRRAVLFLPRQRDNALVFTRLQAVSETHVVLPWQPEAQASLCNTTLALPEPFPKVSGGSFPSGHFNLTLNLQSTCWRTHAEYARGSRMLRLGNFAQMNLPNPPTHTQTPTHVHTHTHNNGQSTES